MPTYRITSELDPDTRYRPSRGVELRGSETRLTTTVEADSLPEAAGFVQQNSGPADEHEVRRVTIIEEVHPGFSYTDEQITAALTRPEDYSTDEPMIAPEQFDADEKVFGGGNFIWTADAVAEALRTSGLVPGLHLSLLQNPSGFVDYSMVEVHDYGRAIYLSRGCEIKHLTDDRGATGWDGVLAIARALIALSNDLH